MKTTKDLDKLLPAVLKQLEKHLENDKLEIGENLFFYEDDDWYIDVEYRLDGYEHNDSGDYWTPPSYWIKFEWSEVQSIKAYYEGEEITPSKEFEDAICAAIDEICSTTYK